MLVFFVAHAIVRQAEEEGATALIVDDVAKVARMQAEKCCCKSVACKDTHASNPADHSEWHQWVVGDKTVCCVVRESRCDYNVGGAPYHSKAADIIAALATPDSRFSDANNLCKKPVCPGTRSRDRCWCNGGASFHPYDFATSTWGSCPMCPQDSVPDGAGRCKCNPGWSGATITWDEETSDWRGQCEKVSCPDGAIDHPNCKCGPLMTGQVSWRFDRYETTHGGCTQLKCPEGFDEVMNRFRRMDEENPCQCMPGTTGKVTLVRFSGRGRNPAGPSHFKGTCFTVACPKSLSGEETALDGDGGQRCVCKDGTAISGQRSRLLQWDKQAVAFTGTCEHSACPDDSSPEADGTCKCDPAFKGTLAFAYVGTTWSWQGTCEADAEAPSMFTRFFTVTLPGLFTGMPEDVDVSRNPWPVENKRRHFNHVACTQCEEAYADARDTFGAVYKHVQPGEPVLFPDIGAAAFKKAYWQAARVVHPDRLNATNREVGQSRFHVMSTCYQNMPSSSNLPRDGSALPFGGDTTYRDCCVAHPSVYCGSPEGHV